MSKRYLRFKDLPSSGYSQVYDGDAGIVRQEPGICCFECLQEEDTYRVILPSLSTGALYDLLHFLQNPELPIYLLTGTEVGRGTYNEPCLQEVQILGRLVIVERHEPLPVYKLDRTNLQAVLAED